MNNVFYIGATGMRAHQNAVEVTASNLANINTNGYKRNAVGFSEMVANPIVSPIENEGLANLASVGVVSSVTPKVFVQGELRRSDNAMDIAVRGDGFIELIGSSGQTLLTRGGTMRVNSDGYLANAQGFALRSLIQVPRDSKDLSIAADGRVSATSTTTGELLQLGQIELVMPADVNALRPVSEGMFRLAEDAQDVVKAQPGESGLGLLDQGALETSNVRLQDELVNLMLLQRAFAANARVVQAADELMSLANSIKR